MKIGKRKVTFKNFIAPVLILISLALQYVFNPFFRERIREYRFSWMDLWTHLLVVSAALLMTLFIFAGIPYLWKRLRHPPSN